MPVLCAVTPDFTEDQRQLIVQLSVPLPEAVTGNQLLYTANHALVASAVCFCLARRLLKGNVVFITLPYQSASSALSYADTLTYTCSALNCLPSKVRINVNWSSFLVHNIPTCSGPSNLAAAISETYPSIQITIPQQWLTTADFRATKTHTSIVIALPSSLTSASLGLMTMTLLNGLCKVALYR